MSDINEKTADIINLCRSAVFCEKGEFYPDKDFGSRIHEAYVKNVTYTKNDNLITVDVLINNEERQVYVVI